MLRKKVLLERQLGLVGCIVRFTPTRWIPEGLFSSLRTYVISYVKMQDGSNYCFSIRIPES